MPSRSLTRGEAAAWGGVVLGALVVRVVSLAARPFHYDEGQVAYFSWRFAEGGDYHYQPILHGPVTYYLTALALKVLGASDFTARLAFSLCGTLVVVLPFFLRSQLGRVAALAAALLLAVSPSFLL